MDKDKILDYVMNSPTNTNRAVLNSMLDSLNTSQEDFIYKGFPFKFKVSNFYKNIDTFNFNTNEKDGKYYPYIVLGNNIDLYSEDLVAITIDQNNKQNFSSGLVKGGYLPWHENEVTRAVTNINPGGITAAIHTWYTSDSMELRYSWYKNFSNEEDAIRSFKEAIINKKIIEITVITRSLLKPDAE